MLISGIKLTRSITSVLALSMLHCSPWTAARLSRKRIETRQSEENVHEIGDSKMVTRRCLVKLRGVSTVFAALLPGLAKALISKLLALGTRAMPASSGPCLKGAGPSDAGPGRQPA
jgi:hypothetical protein